jgi:hypothetical protein
LALAYDLALLLRDLPLLFVLSSLLPLQLVAREPTARRAERTADCRSSARTPNGCTDDRPSRSA